jgi:hypothetical protein
MNVDQVNLMGALLAGLIGSQVALAKFLINKGAISQDELVSYLEATVATLTPEVSDARSLIPLRNLISGIQMERPTMATLQ